MDENKLNISEVESYLYSILEGKVSANVFAGTLPDTTNDKWEDMCLIDCNSISDVNAIGYGTILIWLYAKPKSNGSKNLPIMSKMEHKLNEILKTHKQDTYRISRLNTYPDYDPERKWHCNIVELNIKIV